MSKVLGSLGGYVVGLKNLIEFFRNRIFIWIYIIGLIFVDIAVVLIVIKIIKKELECCMKLW